MRRFSVESVLLHRESDDGGEGGGGGEGRGGGGLGEKKAFRSTSCTIPTQVACSA